MKETVLYERHFESRGKNGKGIMRAVGKLYSLGNQAPYFSLTNNNGCDHERILAAMPELRILADLHLSTKDGAPMHAVSNAGYHIRENDDEALARHLRIPLHEARDIIKEFFWVDRDMERARKDRCDNRVYQIKDILKGLPLDLYKSGAYSQLYSVQSRKPYNAPTLHKELGKAAAKLRAMFGMMRDPLRIRNVMVEDGYQKRGPSGNIPFHDAPRYPGWYSEGYDAELVGAISDTLLIEIWKGTHKTAGIGGVPKYGYDLQDVVKGELTRLVDMVNDITKAVEYKEGNTYEHAQVYIKDIIDSCLASYWQRQADEAIELLKGENVKLEEKEFDKDALLVRINGSVIEVSSTNDYGYLPMVDLDGIDYYVAESKEQAGEKAREYWADMAENDQQEFACIVGDATLIAWGIGKKAGLGSTKVSSLKEWLDLWLNTPEEQWASYDGKASKIEINCNLAEELGFDPNVAGKENDEEGWITVPAYRSK